jgi:hypothetical protein
MQKYLEEVRQKEAEIQAKILEEKEKQKLE